MITRRLLACAAILTLVSSAANAFTLTFDDIPSASDLNHYSDVYGVVFWPGFYLADRSESTWGLPHSGTNVLMWDGNPVFAAGLSFGNAPPDGSGSIPHYSVTLVGGYFSTELDIQLQMIGYGLGGNPVASALIGAPGESWDNVSVEIASAAGEIHFVHFGWVNSPDDRLGFCVDDMTIIPVPEPSALAALLCGLGGVLLRRRR